MIIKYMSKEKFLNNPRGQLPYTVMSIVYNKLHFSNDTYKRNFVRCFGLLFILL